MKRFLVILLALPFAVGHGAKQPSSSSMQRIFHAEMNSLEDKDGLVVTGSHTLCNDRNNISNEAMVFDGNGGLRIDNAPDLSGNFTLTIDFKVDSDKLSGLVLLLSKADYSSNSTREFTLGVGKDSGGAYIILNAFDDSYGNWRGISGYFDPTTYHQAKIEYYSNHAALYVDGDCYGCNNVHENRTDKHAPLLIGYGLNSSTSTPITYQAFSGIIDDVSIYDAVEENDEMKDQIIDNPTLRYSFNHASSTEVFDDSNNGHVGHIFPATEKSNATSSKIYKGLTGNGIYLNGNNLLETDFSINSANDYTVSMNFMLPEIPSAQRILFAQCNYGKNQREISAAITASSLLVLEIRIGESWSSGRAVAEVKPNVWYNFTLVQKANYTYCYINGLCSTIRDVSGRVTNTGATLAFGGTMNNSSGTSFLKCYLDEIVCYNKALTEDELISMIPSSVQTARREVANAISDGFYDNKVNQLSGIKFVSIKMSEQGGYKWQHGVSMTFFNNKFYATWGRNKGAENTAGEESVIFVSDDALTWTHLADLVPETDYSYSHGVIFEHNNNLMLLTPHFAGNSSTSPTGTRFVNLSMHGYIVDGAALTKMPFEVLDFWPLQQPVRMNNGNYIMGGIDEYWRAAVAISDGEDFTSWRVVKIPYMGCGWTETNIMVENNKVIASIRKENPYDVKDTRLGISYSDDYGENWSLIQESDMRFSNSKPCTGTLSDGNEYLIGNSLMGAISSRRALTISLGKNGIYEDLYVIRDAQVPEELKSLYIGKETGQALSYPSTLEKDGKLYVGYSSEMYGGNNNNIELAIIDMNCLYQYRNANKFIEDHKQSSASQIIADFTNLDEYTKSALIKEGYLGPYKYELDKLDMKSLKEIVDLEVSKMLEIIKSANAENRKDKQAEVKKIFSSLSNKQIALIDKEAYLVIKTFLK